MPPHVQIGYMLHSKTYEKRSNYHTEVISSSKLSPGKLCKSIKHLLMTLQSYNCISKLLFHVMKYIDLNNFLYEVIHKKYICSY